MGSNTGQRLQTSCVCGLIRFALIGLIITAFVQGSFCDVEPTESQCRPYIEKALKEQHIEVEEKTFEVAVDTELNSEEDKLSPTDELTDSTQASLTKDEENDDDDDKDEDDAEVKAEDEDVDDENEDAQVEKKDDYNDNKEDIESEDEDHDNRQESKDETDENGENVITDTEEKEVEDDNKKERDDSVAEDPTEGDSEIKIEADDEEDEKDKNVTGSSDASDDDGDELLNRLINIEVQDIKIDDTDEDSDDEKNDQESDKEKDEEEEEKTEEKENDKEEENEEDGLSKTEENPAEDEDEEDKKNDDDTDEIKDRELENADDKNAEEPHDGAEKENLDEDKKSDEMSEKVEDAEAEKSKTEEAAENEAEEDNAEEAPEEEELTKEVIIPENLRPRNHIDKILKLEDSAMETALAKTIDSTLKALKTLYDNAIKPLEILYKYRDLSNRHFGDPEIFSKPLILFMGPWSGGKSSTINYLLDNEFSHTSLRTGAEPSPAYFNILMHGEEEEILDGTQLAADWTFSGLQKFGQSLLDRLKGIKMPNKLLEKVNIVEIPGILEIRKQVQRLFPFNDACQWFIDRADIIFLVYDPSKLDVGPETEAILDQLKGREYQTRIILNKADQIKPEELMRVQGTLIWNISPLMSSSEPPIMYSTSLWSLPYEVGAPTRLLQAQERAFLKDLREAIDKRVENKIASARRFAVRVRNHAKMVDCYLTTYYNHKTIFGNRKKVSDDIIEYPQKYHIYEGLSTLTNISRYDLPDPDVYKDFFKINPLYEFKKLSETCTYFRGCPVNKLDVAIAYDLPELVGKYKKAVESAKEQLPKENS